MKTTKEVHGVQLIEHNDMVVRHQRRTGKTFESESIEAWKNACKNGTAIDVGAYTGIYSIIAEKEGASVIAFEPNYSVYKRLVKNVRLNDCIVECYMEAVSDREGRLRFIGKPGLDMTSAGRVESGEGPGSIVPSVMIDDLALSDVSAIKIDTEGHEVEVLIGSIDTIKKCKPLIITEALDDEALQDQLEVMDGLGYTGDMADERNVIWRP